ncbi:hypothetical protein C8R46DRAFT_1343928 [Mycena filopes]|nr:hypothetical protein C8R46DRAFT_1343928 [Mycena filopes]
MCELRLARWKPRTQLHLECASSCLCSFFLCADHCPSSQSNHHHRHRILTWSTSALLISSHLHQLALAPLFSSNHLIARPTSCIVFPVGGGL